MLGLALAPARGVAGAALLFLACGGDSGVEPEPPVGTEIRLERIAEGLDGPVHVTVAPGDAERVFVVEKTGRIRIIRNGVLQAAPFLDISGLVSGGSEQGLLSVAFHPGYAGNGRFFVDYTNREGDTRVVEYRRGADPDVADPEPVATLLAVDQPYANHNGGLLLFGPDGYLYIGLGDGGSAGDPQENGQDRTTLLGAILRIDVDGPEPYGIPADNPFEGDPSARPEIWAYGLRNPWRFSFDRETGDLYIADVGQNAWEEVDVEPAGSDGGRNYGWNIMEGAHCYGSDDCARAGLVLPAYEYPHDDGACSITGGFVYRGTAIPTLDGHYFFADLCGGWIHSFRYDAGEVSEVRDWTDVIGAVGQVTSFGEDAAGELYLTTLDGDVYRILPAPTP
ncbi:MAG TPA: PQQ-dependent sugar dehydrogenase [Longimicrobiales bacterium]